MRIAHTCLSVCVQELWGYRYHPVRRFLTWAAIVVSLGLLRLVFHWKPHWGLYCMCRQCPAQHATHILLKVTFLYSLLKVMVTL